VAALSQSSEELCCSYNHNRSHKWLSTPSILVRSFVLHCQYPLSLSGACHEDVAASTSRGHAGLSIACCLAVARPKLSGRRSSSTVLSQVCLSRSWAGADHPQPFSARFASVFQFFVASLWEDAKCRPGQLGSGLHWCRHSADDQRRTSAIDG